MSKVAIILLVLAPVLFVAGFGLASLLRNNGVEVDSKLPIYVCAAAYAFLVLTRRLIKR